MATSNQKEPQTAEIESHPYPAQSTRGAAGGTSGLQCGCLETPSIRQLLVLPQVQVKAKHDLSKHLR
jgi:hypothetical protein